MTTKERLLAAINKVQPLDEYNSEDIIYGQKYGFPQPLWFTSC